MFLQLGGLLVMHDSSAWWVGLGLVDWSYIGERLVDWSGIGSGLVDW